MIPKKLVRTATAWSIAFLLLVAVTALAQKFVNKDPAPRSPDAQVAQVPLRAGNLQPQAPAPPQDRTLVGTNLGTEVDPNNTFATANSLGANPEGRIRGQLMSVNFATPGKIEGQIGR